jgi:amino acid adenylation domain-containing protein
MSRSSEPSGPTVRDSVPAIWRAYNATGGAYSGAPLHAALVHQIRSGRTGGAIVTPAITLTYPELDRLARAVAHALRAERLPRGALIPIVMDKGWEQIVAALGILAIGGAYVPIDAHLPDQRIRGLLAQVGASTVITQPGRAERVAALGVPRRIVVAQDMPAASPSSPALDADAAAGDVAYVMFTSGSTGTPKGVVMQHGAASNTIEDVNARIRLTSADAAFGISSLGFDLSVYDIFGVLGGGGTLVLPDGERLLDPIHWAELAARHAVTVWNSVPALAQMFLDGCRQSGHVAPVRTFLMSGDWIPLALPPALSQRFPGTAVMALGGATEAAIWSIAHDIEAIDPAWRSIPYGRPLRNQRMFVLDDQLALASEGVVGEIFIAGAGLAREYLGDADQTARSFFLHPGLGERVYRTGDFGRMLPCGEIEFLGRRDGQAKLHGNRIELGDVEAALLATPGVTAAAARLFQPARGSPQLIGYVVCDRAVPAGAVRETAAARLPAYMIPSHVVAIERLPLTANGKVDRAALPPPAHADADAGPNDAPAITGGAEAGSVEARVLEIYRRVLGRASFSVADDLFISGGDSHRAVQIALELRAVLPAGQLSGRDVMRFPTVAAILRRAAENRARTA